MQDIGAVNRINLPPDFLAEMKELFATFSMSAQWPDFLESFNQKALIGLRANRLKIEPDQLLLLLTKAFGHLGPIERVPWSDDGFILPAGSQPGRLPAYLAGLYYIQEPSAMLPAAILAARPGETVLDCCAAPGGKTTRIAADLANEGLLWANDLSAKRVQALKKNVALSSARRTVISCADISDLAGQLEAYFDAILTDVPCSGSGMFRRDQAAVNSWQTFKPESLAPRQYEILAAAWRMLKPGGRLVYSTCSFSRSENEEVIERFLAHHEDGSLAPVDPAFQLEPGLSGHSALKNSVRIWPHLHRGEGHFCALLVKRQQIKTASYEHKKEAVDPALLSIWQAFCKDNLTVQGREKVNSWLKNSVWQLRQNNLILALKLPLIKHPLRILTNGLLMGRVHLGSRKVSFEPSAELLLCLGQADLKRTLTLPAQSPLLERLLRGETLVVDVSETASDWRLNDRVAVLVQYGDTGYPLAWARVAGDGLLKNEYPKNWVRNG